MQPSKIKRTSSFACIEVQHTPEVEELCKPLVLSNIQLRQIMARMEESFVDGLLQDSEKKPAVKMLPTYIRSVDIGEERGKFLALDLGGTHFRVLLITLEGNGKCTMKSKFFDLPDQLQKGSGIALFDHIAACLAKFMEEHDLKGKEKLPLGFTFSFPCRQLGLTSAYLVNWTKGFNASGVVDKDVSALLFDACSRQNVDVFVAAVLNDTTGTMLACSFLEKHCYIGVIVGTGTNACYMESLDKIPKLQGKIFPEKDGLPAEMCVNTEWGGFGDDGKLNEFLTKWDDKVDDCSINAGEQRFEKSISGMYMGDIVRYVLEDLTNQRVLFDGHHQINLRGFSTKLVSDIEKQIQEHDPLTKIQEMLQKIGIRATATDCANVAYVCSLVSKRAAHLCACGIAALLKRMNKEFVTIGVDGSVYRFHPTFKDLLDSKIDELLDGKYKYKFVLSQDGSGRGAAVAAAVATRMSRITEEHRGATAM